MQDLKTKCNASVITLMSLKRCVLVYQKHSKAASSLITSNYHQNKEENIDTLSPADKT